MIIIENNACILDYYLVLYACRIDIYLPKGYHIRGQDTRKQGTDDERCKDDDEHGNGNRKY